MKVACTRFILTALNLPYVTKDHEEAFSLFMTIPLQSALKSE